MKKTAGIIAAAMLFLGTQMQANDTVRVKEDKLTCTTADTGDEMVSHKVTYNSTKAQLDQLVNAALEAGMSLNYKKRGFFSEKLIITLVIDQSDGDYELRQYKLGPTDGPQTISWYQDREGLATALPSISDKQAVTLVR